MLQHSSITCAVVNFWETRAQSNHFNHTAADNILAELASDTPACADSGNSVGGKHKHVFETSTHLPQPTAKVTLNEEQIIVLNPIFKPRQTAASKHACFSQ